MASLKSKTTKLKIEKLNHNIVDLHSNASKLKQPTEYRRQYTYRPIAKVISKF